MFSWMMLVGPGDESSLILHSNSIQILQHNQNLSRCSCIDVDLSHTWQVKSRQSGTQKQLPALNGNSHGACRATVHRINATNPSCSHTSGSPGTAWETPNSSRPIPPRPRLSGLKLLFTSLPARVYYPFILHSFPLTHLITGSGTALLLQEAQEHLCCVIIRESSYLRAVFRAPQGVFDAQTAEIMLTSLSRTYKAVISNDAPFLW